MTVARQLADFLAGVSVADLPSQALDHATMLIASTIASAAAGTQLASARIVRDRARTDRRCRAGERGDERCRRVG